MKIKTEILNSIYIVTCEGPCLIPPSVEVFLNAMTAMIEKRNMDILFDLTDIQLVGAVQLDSISQALKKIKGNGRIYISGIVERDIKLLKLTHPHLRDTFTLSPSRNEALNTLFWDEKNAPEILSSVISDLVSAEEESEKLSTTETTPSEKFRIAQAEEQQKKEEEATAAARTAKKTVPDDAPVTKKKRIKKEKPELQPLSGRERRRFGRIKSRQFMDGDFYIFCKSSITGKNYVAIVQDIGIGGLLMTLSPPKIAEKEKLVLEGRIGKYFKFKENAAFHSRREELFVFQFVNLSHKTTVFLNQLFASLNK